MKKKLFKYCPRCREEMNQEFNVLLQSMDRGELIKMIKGFKAELENK